MKNLALAALLLATACGYTQRDNETVAYVKHVTNETPMFCYNHVDAELDMRTPGTMTSERVRFSVLHESDAAKLRDANVAGAKVKITSDSVRVAWCTQDDVITKVELIP